MPSRPMPACWRRSAPGREKTLGTGCRWGARTRHSSSLTCARRAPRASIRAAPVARRRKSASCRCAITSSPSSGATTQPTAASSPTFLLDRCCVVQVTATDIDQAHRMFEVLNARGKPLARNDILKAELLERRAGRIGACRQGNLGRGRSSRRRALRAAFQPYPRHVSAARRQGDLRHQADRRREGRRVGVHRADPAAGGGHLR